MAWKIQNIRPEDTYSPLEFYTSEEIKRFSNSSSMKKRQIEIAQRMLKLSGIETGKILDLGCGAGFVLGFLKDQGFKPVGVDVVKSMIAVCKSKHLEAHDADMRELPFKDNSFDSAISVSALQWLIGENADIKKVAKELNRVLKSKSKAVFQFYPNSEERLIAIAGIFSRNGFSAKVAIDNSDNPKKRLCFVLLQKD